MKTFEIVRDHEIVATDGVKLRGDLYRPTDQAKPAHVVLYRTPYQKERLSNEIFAPFDCLEAGFYAYVQDIRGFGKSEGVPNLIDWESENRDSWETVESLSKEDWCSGSLAIGGTSFVGMVALSATAKLHPAVKALFPSMVAVNPFEARLTKPWLRLEEVLVWLLQMTVQKELRLVSGDFTKLTPALKQTAGYLGELGKLFEEIRKSGVPEIFEELEGGLISRIIKGEVDPFPNVTTASLGKVPSLFLTGWYDTFSNATIQLAEAWIAAEGSERRSSLIVGAWTHSNQLISNIGQVNFGAKATGASIGVPRRHAQFLAACLEGEEPPHLSNEYELFGNRWTDAESGSPSIEVSLHLREVRSEVGPDDKEVTPTLGGQTHFSAGGLPGPIDQSPLLSSSNVAFFESDELQEVTTIAQPISLDIPSLGLEAPVLFLKLTVTNAFGQILPLQEGICTSAGRPSYTFPRIRAKLKAGEKLGLIVCTSCYPRYAPLSEQAPKSVGFANSLPNQEIKILV